MLGGWGEVLGGVLLLFGPLVLVVGDRMVIWFVSLASPFWHHRRWPGSTYWSSW